MSICPKCASSSTRKSRKQSSRHLTRAWHQAAYRCDDCGHRFVATDSTLFLRWSALALLLLLFVTGVLLIATSGSDVDATLPMVQSQTPLRGSALQRSRAYAGQAGAAALEAAAESGDRDSQYQLAMVLQEESESSGDFSVRDTSIRWLEEAAANGHPQAQAEMGALYLAGRGVLQDFSAAASWYEKAARQGDTAAMYELGRMTQSGWGVDEDLVDAYVWLNVASARGEERAETLRDQVMKLLTADKLMEAQQRAREINDSIPRSAPAESAQSLR
jgi:hypothetical protein